MVSATQRNVTIAATSIFPTVQQLKNQQHLINIDLVYIAESTINISIHMPIPQVSKEPVFDDFYLRVVPDYNGN